MTDQLAEIVLSEPTIENLQQEGKRQGMITMFQDGILKTLRGVVSIDELLEVAQAGDSA